jgi:hypothetical protein
LQLGGRQERAHCIQQLRRITYVSPLFVHTEEQTDMKCVSAEVLTNRDNDHRRKHMMFVAQITTKDLPAMLAFPYDLTFVRLNPIWNGV